MSDEPKWVERLRAKGVTVHSPIMHEPDTVCEDQLAELRRERDHYRTALGEIAAEYKYHGPEGSPTMHAIAARALAPERREAELSAIERVEWNKDGTIDEIVACGGRFHMEQMGDGCYWFAVYDPDSGDKRFSWNLFADGRIEARVQDNELDIPTP